MPSVSVNSRRLGNGETRWRLQYRRPDRTTGVRTFTNEPAARKWEAVFRAVGIPEGERMLDDRDEAEARGMTVWEAVERSVAARSGITVGTREGYMREARRDILPRLGALPLALLTRDVVSSWVNELAARGLSGKTIANRHGLLSSVCAWAVENGHLPRNPCKGVRLPRSVKREPVFLSPPEVADLLAVLVDQRYRDFVMVLVGTGLRWGEATALEVGDIVSDDRHVVIRVTKAWKDTDSGPMVAGPPKTKRSRRTVPLPRMHPAADALLRAVDGRTSGYVFTSPRGAVLRNSSFHQRVWIPTMRALEAAGWTKRPSIHDLRHTAASLMIAAGAELHAVSAVLGHEHISTTVNIYGHFRAGARESALEALGNALSGDLGVP